MWSIVLLVFFFFFFFFQAEDGIRDWSVTGVQTCALPISVKLGREAAEKCLSRADLKPEDIDLIITVSRSEEHTSELQSLTNLVCRLLLEKKKNKNNRTPANKRNTQS